MCVSFNVPAVSDHNDQSCFLLYQPPGTKMCLHERSEISALYNTGVKLITVESDKLKPRE